MPVVVAFLIAVAALGGGVVAHTVMPPETRAEIVAQLVDSFQPGVPSGVHHTALQSGGGPGGSAAGEAPSSPRLGADEPVTGTVPVSGTQPLSTTLPTTNPITGTLPPATATPTATVPVTPSITITGTTGRPDDGPGHRGDPITGTIQISLTAIVSDVRQLADDPDVRGESWKGLLAKLAAVQASLARGNDRAAQHALDAFLHELNAFQRAGRLDPAGYRDLYVRYEALITALGKTPRAEATPKTEPGAGKDRQGASPDDDARDGHGDPAEGEHARRGHGKPTATPTPPPGTSVAPPVAGATPGPRSDRDDRGRSQDEDRHGGRPEDRDKGSDDHGKQPAAGGRQSAVEGPDSRGAGSGDHGKGQAVRRGDGHGERSGKGRN
ncbi:MAG: hypothetical protein HY331_11035 [Chloroflexi bacterium]|nr:hypothetical protein [Chloroflexota bacterium]